MLESIEILLSALNESSKQVSDTEQVDWKQCYELASDHNLQFYVFDYFEPIWSKEFKSTKLYQQWHQEYLICVFEHQRLRFKAEKAIAKLSENNIPYIVLKGKYLSELYKNPSVRVFGDIDILIERKNMEDIDRVLCEEGFILERKSDKDRSYINDDSLPIEVHFKVFESQFFGDTGWFNTLLFANKIKTEYPYEYRLDYTEELVYLIGHCVKHYYYSGSGLRNLYDIKLYIKKHKSEINFDIAFDHLQKLGCLKYAMYLIELCNQIFMMGFEHGYAVEQRYIDSLKEETVKAGLFGHEVYLEKTKEKYDGTFIEKIKFVFLNYDAMKDKYHILKRYKVLLPLFWGVRIISIWVLRKDVLLAFVKHKKVNEHVEIRYELNSFLKNQ